MKIKPKVEFNSKSPSKTDATVQPATLWDRCKHIAKKTDILGEFNTAIQLRGLVREKNNAALLYLGFTSRLFQNPVPIVVKGDSSGGKSGLVKVVLLFFPNSSYLGLTGMSDKALLYSDESFEHRFLVIGESHGLSSEKLNYYIRTIISEGYIEDLVTVPAAGGHGTKKVRKEGPTGVITTTTSDLHRENETRMFSIDIDESPETTSGVMVALAKEAVAPSKLAIDDWLAFQEWLGRQGAKVNIPFAVSVAKLIPPLSLRLRRDFGNLQTLIKAHALLHRKSRQQSADGAVIAEFRDYEAVRRLIARSLAETVERSVSKPIRLAVGALKALKKRHVMVDELADKLGLNKSSVSRTVGKAIKAGYLVNDETRQGRPLKIALGNPLPEDQELLPSTEKVRLHHAARMAKLRVKAKLKARAAFRRPTRRVPSL